MEEQKNSSKYRPQVRHVGGKRRRRDDFGPSSPSRSSTEPLLPADVLDLILDRLPVWERCRMRCVCKAWNNPSKLKSGEEELWFLMVRPPRYGPDYRCRRSRPPKYGDIDWCFRAYSSDAREDQLAGGRLFQPPLPNAHHSQLSALLGGRNCSHISCRFNFSPKIPLFLTASIYPLQEASSRLWCADLVHGIVMSSSSSTASLVVSKCSHLPYFRPGLLGNASSCFLSP
ncbi:hypothetical protein L7F22_040056 [Adiantum nelumboides]|nr:hypothetical protein [Adiantum nelumboides]